MAKHRGGECETKSLADTVLLLTAVVWASIAELVLAMSPSVCGPYPRQESSGCYDY